MLTTKWYQLRETETVVESGPLFHRWHSHNFCLQSPCPLNHSKLWVLVLKMYSSRSSTITQHAQGQTSQWHEQIHNFACGSKTGRWCTTNHTVTCSFTCTLNMQKERTLEPTFDFADFVFSFCQGMSMDSLVFLFALFFWPPKPNLRFFCSLFLLVCLQWDLFGKSATEVIQHLLGPFTLAKMSRLSVGSCHKSETEQGPKHSCKINTQGS